MCAPNPTRQGRQGRAEDSAGRAGEQAGQAVGGALHCVGMTLSDAICRAFRRLQFADACWLPLGLPISDVALAHAGLQRGCL